MYREVVLLMAQPTSERTQETQTMKAVTLTAPKVRGRKTRWLCEGCRLTGEDTTIITITIIEGQEGIDEEIDEIGSPLGAMIVGESQGLVHDVLGVEGGIERNVGSSSCSPALIRVSTVLYIPHRNL
jgi:hypothetical protein